MNEKAKKVLSYVACTLGGAFLGIACLGGLSYCSTSAKKQTEEVNTIIATKKNAEITTENGGYEGYRFTPSVSDTYVTHNNSATFYHWDFSSSSLYELENVTYESLTCASLSSWISLVNSNYSSYAQSTTLSFMSAYGRIPLGDGAYHNVQYHSFVMPTSNNRYGSIVPFIWTNKPSGAVFAQLNTRSWTLSSSNATNYYILNAEQCGYWAYDSLMKIPVFQDVESYFSELGYQNGYSEGNTDGYDNGYSTGYGQGSSAGYESGYDQGFLEGYMNTYYAFTSLIVNRNAIWRMADIPWHSNNDIYIESGHLGDYPFLDPSRLQTNTYVNWAYLALFRDTATLIPYWIYAQRYTTSQNNGYVNFVIRISPADQTSTENAGNIGSYSGGVSLSATSIFQTENVTEWTAPNRCQLIAFGSEDPRDIYRDWFDNGYILPRGIAVDENAYEQGYKQGQLDAQQNTSMNNVFALFTPAFGAVASFFDMKIFGFLPLYWFLIAPLFIALISLIMRMVKH